MNTALVPGYKQSIYDLSQSVVLEDIRISGNIHTLKGLRPEQGLGNVPSWCIDWSSYDYWAEDPSRALADVRSLLYAATADTRPSFVVLSHRKRQDTSSNNRGPVLHRESSRSQWLFLFWWIRKAAISENLSLTSDNEQLMAIDRLPILADIEDSIRRATSSRCMFTTRSGYL